MKLSMYYHQKVYNDKYVTSSRSIHCCISISGFLSNIVAITVNNCKTIEIRNLKWMAREAIKFLMTLAERIVHFLRSSYIQRLDTSFSMSKSVLSTGWGLMN